MQGYTKEGTEPDQARALPLARAKTSEVQLHLLGLNPTSEQGRDPGPAHVWIQPLRVWPCPQPRQKPASCQGEAQLPQALAPAPQASRPSSLFSPVSAVRTTARLTFGRAGPLTGRTQNLSAALWLRPYYDPMVLLKNKWKSKLSFNQQPGKATNLIKIKQTTKSVCL